MRRTSAFGAMLVMVVVLLFPNAAFAGAEAKAINSLNHIRQAHGLSKLHASGSLGASANRYARRMLANDFFGHQTRVSVSRRFHTAGETLAINAGYNAQPRRTVSRWMNSPPHRAVLLSSRFRFVGMGMEQGSFQGNPTTMWVAHVGSP